MTTNDDELTSIWIGTKPTYPKRGCSIPHPPSGHPKHGHPRAGVLGDPRPLCCRLADPRFDSDLGVHATHGDAVRALAQHP